MEGVNQALAFTKSVKLVKGLPESVLELAHFTKIDEQDERVQKYVIACSKRICMILVPLALL